MRVASAILGKPTLTLKFFSCPSPNSMPRPTYGPTVKNRALRLFEALVSFAQDIANQGNPDIKFRWIEKNSSHRELVIQTQTRFLIELTKKDNYPGSLSKPQVVEALQRMEDFLGILEDNRVKKKGKDERHFTLTLYCQDLATNLERFNQQWENKRPDKSKQQEQATATTPAKTCQAFRPKPGVPFQAPPLPAYFVQRPEISQSLKQSLLSEQTAKTGTLVVSAIYGLGGIGKSTLAAAIANDPEVQTHFPDGILWATLGQQPDLLSFLSSWIQALGDNDYKPTNTNAASRHLQTLLFDKATLLVVDDAWNPDHVEPFRIGGAKCRVLVTTREAQIVGVTRYDLDVMSPSQALALLEEYGGSQLQGSDRKQAQALAKTVGYLPLALELAAAQIADGISWQELLTDLQKEIALLETLDLPGAQEVDEKRRKHYSLVASFNLSLRRLPSEKFQQFAWFGVLPEDVSITPALGTTLWDVSAREARKTLQYFKSKALLLSGKSTNGTATYQLHDLVHDMARRLLTDQAATGEEESLPGLGLTWPQAHGQLLERYRQKTQNGLWYTLPDDGYSHSYLTWHLEKAGWVEEVHQLLQEETETGHNGWYETCERLDQLGGFVKDVAKAWQLAEEAFSSSPTRSISLQCRYALMVSSINSLLGHIPGELMAALVEKKIWTPVQALAYLQHIQDPSNRAEALKELAPKLPETLLSEALKIARAITDQSDRARALSGLARHWPEILPEALEAAQAITDKWSRAYALIRLAPQLPQILSEALEAAQAITDEWSRARALSELAPQLPQILPEALEAARAITDESSRAYALSQLPRHWPEILPEALEAARTITDESSRAHALSQLARYFPEILPEALEAARALTNQSDRAIALSRLARHLPEILPEALEVAQATTNEWSQAHALSKLAPQLPQILPKALEAARALTHQPSRAHALRELAPHLPKSLLPEALDMTRAITDDRDRSYALSKLAKHSPESLLPQVLDVARAITDESDRVYALSKLAPHLPEILPEALEAARAITDDRDRAYALSELAPHLPEILPEALEAARAITDKSDRANVLSELAPHLPEILPEALEAARAITDNKDRAYALSKLAPHLPEILPEALEVVQTITNEWSRVYPLGTLAPHLPESLFPQALEVARAITDESSRAYALETLAKHLPESLLPQALEVARVITDKSRRADALSGLAPQLPQILTEALEAARELTDKSRRAYPLSTLAPHCPQSLLPEVLEMAQAIQSEYHRARVFSGLIKNPGLSLQDDVSLWQEFLHTLACRDREDFLRDLVNLSPTIISLGGKEALAAIVEAIKDVSRWWP
ncbi:NB-ARC domain-containing protein [Moorena producens JHB]|uniref:NB-ARC domain-containing protein n=1 Tax=Moorena producens (strain JHB) TaxID=1454205 RepID=A0A1D9GBF5_MOOP1|nr:NB-ARC domain-containing protein [Moorena producens]AOY84978.2 NB-ARC domain-containing protein [Moorena producens JHB]